MKSIIKRLMTFALLAWIVQAAVAGDLIIIANQSVPDDTLRSKEVRNIYYGKRTRWSDGSPLIPVARKSSSVQSQFVTDVLKKSVGQYESFWRQALFTGEGIPPRAFETEEELRRFVAETPGALGFVERVPDEIEVKKLVIIE
ncbi:hypothetical protein KKC97_10805 [bacterium]|nr:hypothetical protein [bacterium]MBU1638142.1 hypothetical protein [bacterium]